MSLDIAGPFETGVDQAVQRPRYYVTSVTTIPKVGDNPLVEGLLDCNRLPRKGLNCHVAGGRTQGRHWWSARSFKEKRETCHCSRPTWGVILNPGRCRELKMALNRGSCNKDFKRKSCNKKIRFHWEEKGKVKI